MDGDPGVQAFVVASAALDLPPLRFAPAGDDGGA